MNDLTLQDGAGGADERVSKSPGRGKADCAPPGDTLCAGTKFPDLRFSESQRPSELHLLNQQCLSEIAAHAVTQRELAEAKAQLAAALYELDRLQQAPLANAEGPSRGAAVENAATRNGADESVCVLYVEGAPPGQTPAVKESEAHLRMLMRELTHRSKNLLAVVQAIARQSARQGNVAYFLEHFSARLQALSRSHDLLVQESWSGVSLHDLVRSQLAQYLAHERVQVSLEGPDTRLKPEVAQSLGLALHELAANATKYGALSRSRGRVGIAWRLTEDGLDLLWSESGGPKVKAPTRRGFGSVAIEHNLARVLGCKVELNFAAEGLQCRVFVPRGQFAVREARAPMLEPGAALSR